MYIIKVFKHSNDRISPVYHTDTYRAFNMLKKLIMKHHFCYCVPTKLSCGGKTG